MRPAIRVENLSKQYRIGARRRGGYRTLRESIMDAVTAPWRRLRGQSEETAGEHWALQDVSFEVQPGEITGIVGRNGAGKSTLLKILSRITEPTAGRVELHGRVGSLLEVGTGFHPELTGRENIYLNGAILGMTRREVARRFDDIVAFAECEKFLETPVKHYSSGMYVRLGFAVAAHVEPEILIIDEVLAVGDANFQNKCFKKIHTLAQGGRTVLFVSHNLAAVSQFCVRAILLSHGVAVCQGPASEVIDTYLNTQADDLQAETVFADRPDRPVNFTRLCLRNDAGEPAAQFTTAEAVTLEIEYVVRQPLTDDVVWLTLERVDGIRITKACEDEDREPPSLRAPGRRVMRVRFPGGVVNAGVYRFQVLIGTPRAREHDRQWSNYFELEDVDRSKNLSMGSQRGIVRLPLTWTEEPLE
jgi:lipopolysaccharide transport system ATP-binding protein